MFCRQAIVVLLSTAFAGCNDSSPATLASAAGESSRDEAAIAEEAIGYPVGPWRGVPRSQVVLSASHIAVAHRDAQGKRPLPSVVSSPRSKEEALKKARELRRELAAHPERFASLAQRESDDRTSAPLGGSLGIFRAHVIPAEFVDALANLQPGQVSRVIETEQGYHLLQRHRVPPEAEFALSHIVIKTDESSGWRRSDRPTPPRDRATALALAQRVAELAATDPSRFEDLVREHSDADDVERKGDMGVRSRYDDTGSESVLFEAGWRLTPGALSAVIESGTGFHVLRRAELGSRRRIAASAIAILHDEAQARDFNKAPMRTREKARAMALELIAELGRKPDRFAQLQREYCDIGTCDRPYVFREGRGLVALERAAVQLGPGQIAAVPIDSPIGWLVVRREDETQVPEPEAPQLLFDFSAPPIAVFDESAHPGAEQPTSAKLAYELTRFERYARDRMKLDAATDERLHRLFDELASGVENAVDGDYELHFARAEKQMRELLGPERHEELTRYRRGWLRARER